MSFSDDTLQLCQICKDVIVKNPKKHYEKGVPCNILSPTITMAQYQS